MRSIESQRGIRKHAQTAVRAHERRDSGDAFIKDPSGGLARARTNDELAERLAEQFVGSITAAQSSNAFEDTAFTEELGGPFITTRARHEFARGVDASNPADAERAALPSVMSSLVADLADDDADRER